MNKLFADLLASSSGSKNNQGPRIQKRRGVEIKSAREVQIMRKSSHIVATVLSEINKIVEPGMTTGGLDEYAERRIREMGAVPSFKGYHGFPASICASINNEVVHGIPDLKRVIKAGDLLKVDTGAFFDGYHGDSCITICVGDVSEEASKLSRVANEALMAGLSQIRANNTLLDIAGAIEDHVTKNNFSVVEDYTGHGVGRNLHEEPSVFNFRTNDLPNIRLREGMTLAVEPILNAGSKGCRTLQDQWTVVTKDGSLSAQWEHTILVTKKGFEILTDRS
ncbi:MULTISPECIES: type I methionyl aminopeptidase [Prochlorococcus]|uniref:Methionine aminopeptidase n=1 Tax=Prochlorococcus marinus (strain SARG / CCMP1375 / SS120) TaxID=167539 RepID=Q7VDA8_PROMA|nr:MULTISPECIES: type I methionyl aminopeptidase [Prochlorococcus]AAP99520.1 Methionine aminopeptidase [Prochlorococcus marinus subsp. marinus str. CCMP1375]KGG11208.1 Methionine aminopeptidase [Prochlorococcus marinus str. LG]KGG21546.1 Methionine aminopeptidase [Prochlorococcus marinus str. SS2]KGG23111.1 Methionine aminopeptidase [Prochlorococcus marinus str. SS35]KGG33821.1 Methionine aminopeptidase [Prochlorococcus marinus str. SS51]